jgi:hypothetical protein
MTVNDSASPLASAKGPKRLSERAAPKTNGINGKKQGDRIENKPAKKAKPSVAAILSA